MAQWLENVKGDFLVPKALLCALPPGAQLLSAEKIGVSTWTRIAKITVRLANGARETYFFKSITGKGARPLAEGEYESALAIQAVIPGTVPEPAGWGKYIVGKDMYYFYLCDYYDMDLSKAPDPVEFSTLVAKMHNSTSPNGMFGFSVPTVIGKMERTVTWEKSWAASFTHQLKDVIRFDNETNGPWPQYDAACEQLIKAVIPRLLGVLQSEGRSITPALIHGDAHNEMEFGTWRCTWTSHFAASAYMRHYQRLIGPSEPEEEWDDRNRLYSIHPYLTDSAGHKGSLSRQLAYNDMLYLCEKYAPLETLEKYDPEKDIALTGARVPFVIEQLE